MVFTCSNDGAFRIQCPKCSEIYFREHRDCSVTYLKEEDILSCVCTFCKFSFEHETFGAWEARNNEKKPIEEQDTTPQVIYMKPKIKWTLLAVVIGFIIGKLL